MWLFFVAAVCALYGAWLTRHIGGPFRPIRNEVEEVLFQSLIATAGVCFFAGVLIGI
jgi:hypothetical protein